MDGTHRKTPASRREARRERRVLRLVQGPGVAPLDDGAETEVVTRLGVGTLADLLAERGPLRECAVRGVAAHVARALARLHGGGIVHGDVKPSNVVFAPGGGLWLIDFDAAGADGEPRRRGTRGRLRQATTLAVEDDAIGLTVMAVECATGTRIDPSVPWSQSALERVGCSPELAADIAVVLLDPPAITSVGAILQRRDDRLPAPPRRRGTHDPTPTVDIPSVGVTGLSPCGDGAAPP